MMLCSTCGMELEPGQQSCVTGYPTHQIYTKGEEKMEANGRVRLKIAKHSKGWSYEFTIEQGNDGDLKQAMYDTLQETQAFKKDVEEMIRSWEMQDARKAQG